MDVEMESKKMEVESLTITISEKSGDGVDMVNIVM